MPIPISDQDLARSATARVPLGEWGASGATLERLTFADGGTLIRKAFSAAEDWMMRATDDPGRAATLWTTGVMDRLPASLDAAIVRIERHDAGRPEQPTWVLYMTDVSEHFLRAGSRLSPTDARRFLDAFAEMHAAFAGRADRPAGDLCSIEQLIGLASPETAAREAGSHPFVAILHDGWSSFDELAPDDIRAAIHTGLADPRPLADALRAEGTTLLHADPHYGNVAPGPDRFYIVDWGLATWGPAAIDFAWWLDQSARLVDASREELIAAFLAAEAGRASRRSVDLAFLAELALAGWQYADAIRDDDEGRRAARRGDFAWWVAAARRGLEHLG